MYGWAISQKVPVSCFEWIKKSSEFDQCFMKIYNEISDKGCFLKVDVEYPKTLFNGIAFRGVALNLHNYLPFLSERNKIKKCNKLVRNIYDKENYVVHIRALKQALNHGLILKNDTK